MDTFVNPYKPQEPTAEDRFNYRRQMGINGQQAFQQSQKNTNDTVGNGFFGHLVDAAQANAAGLFAGQLRAVDEGLNWAGEKLGLAEKTGTRDKSGWLEQAAQAMDEIQRRNTAQEELTGLNYLAQQVGSVLGSMAAMTAETVALGGGLSLAGKGIGALARLAGIASKTNAGANVTNLIGASGNLTSKAIGAARKMWGGNYLQNYYKLQMMNSPAEALGQAGNLLKQLEDEGYDRDAIRAAALWSGTLNAAFLPLANMAEGKMASMGANMIAKNIVGKEAAKAAMAPTMLGLKATLGKAAGTSAWQGLTEGGEEGVQDYIDQFSTQAAQGKDFKDMEWDHATAAKSFIDAGVGSAALGFLGGATNYRSRAKNFNANGHNFQLSDDGRTWSVDGKDRIMKPDFNDDGTPAIDKETNKQTESLQPYTAKEIADLMGNDVTESDVRGAMRAEKAKTTNVSSGDARPVTVESDAKKEGTEQQPVPGFTVVEDDNGNAIYTDNISGVMYNSKDGWVIPANDNTDGKQLYNTNTGNFANANTKRVLQNGDTVDVVSGEVTKKENETKKTPDETTVPKKENVVTPPVEPAPVAAPAPAPVVDKKADEVPKVQPEAPQVLNKNQEIKLGVARALVDSKHISRAEHQSIAKYINEHPDDDRNMDVIIREVLDRNFEMPSADTIVNGVEKVKEKQAGKKVGNGTTTTTEDGRIIHTYSSNTSSNITKALDKLKNELYDTEFITNDEYEKAIEAIYALAKRGEKIKWAQMLSSIRGKSFKYPTADEIAKRRLEIENRNKENENAEIVNAKPEEVKSEVLEVADKGKPEDGEGSKPEEKKVVQEPKPNSKRKDKKPEREVVVVPDDLTPTKVQQEMLDELDEDDTEVFGESDGEVELGALRKELPREEPKATAKKEEPKPVERKNEEPKVETVEPESTQLLPEDAERKVQSILNGDEQSVTFDLPGVPELFRNKWGAIVFGGRLFYDNKTDMEAIKGQSFTYPAKYLRVAVAEELEQGRKEQERLDRMAKDEELAKQEKEKLIASYNGFLDNKNAMQRARIMKTMSVVQTRVMGDGQEFTTDRKGFVELAINEGVGASWFAPSKENSIVTETERKYFEYLKKQKEAQQEAKVELETKAEVNPTPATSNNSYNQYLETKTEAQRKKAQDFLEKETTVAEDVQAQLGKNQIKNKKELVEAIAAAKLPLKKIGNRYKYQTPDGKSHLASKTELDYYNYLIGQNEQETKAVEQQQPATKNESSKPVVKEQPKQAEQAKVETDKKELLSADEAEKKKLAVEIVVKHRQFVAKAKGFCNNFYYQWKKYMGLEMDGLSKVAEYLDKNARAVCETAHQEILAALNDFVNAANVYDKGGPSTDVLVKLSKEELENKYNEAEGFYSEELSRFRADVRQKLSDRVMAAVKMLRSIRTGDTNAFTVIQKRCDHIEYNMFKTFDMPKPNPVTTQENITEEITEEQPAQEESKDEYGMSPYDFDDFVDQKFIQPLENKLDSLSPEDAKKENVKAKQLINTLNAEFGLEVRGETVEGVIKKLVRQAIDNNTEEANRAIVNSIESLTDIDRGHGAYLLSYYDYLLGKYNTNAAQQDVKYDTINIGANEKDPEAQAQKITAKRETSLNSYIQAALSSLQENIVLDDDTMSKLRAEYNKVKYDNKIKSYSKKVKKGDKKFGGDVTEFLGILDSVNPQVLDNVILKEEKFLDDNGEEATKKTTLRDYYNFKKNGNQPFVIQQLLLGDDDIEIEKIKKEAQSKLDKIKPDDKDAKSKKKTIEFNKNQRIKKIKADQMTNGVSSKIMASINKCIGAIGGGSVKGDVYNEMQSVGRVAAVEAANTYDIFNDKNATFLTWARNNIENKLKQYLTDSTHTRKISSKEAVAIKRMHEAEDTLNNELDSKPTVEQVASRMGITPEEVLELQRIDYQTKEMQEEVRERYNRYGEDDGNQENATGRTETLDIDEGDPLRYDTENVYNGDKAKVDDTDNASIVADTDVRGKILTPANEEMVVKQIEQLFRGMGIKQVSPHIYDIKLPFGGSLQIDMTTTSAQLINELGDKVGPLRAIAGVKDGSFAGLYSFKNGINLIRLTDAVRNGTVPHEVAHFIFNAIFSPIERRKIIDYYKTKIAEGHGLTEEQLELRAQELFCDDFAKYFLNQKDVPRSKLQMIFERMKNFLRKLVDMFSFKNHPYTEEELDLRRDDVNVNEESLAALFGRIANGDIYNRGLNQNENAVVVAQLVSERQAMNLNDTAKAVRKAKVLLDKGMKPTEVWKKTGCLRYGDGTIKMYIPFSNKDIRGTGLPKGFDVQSLPIQRNDVLTDGKIYARIATVKLTDILTPNNKFFKLVPSLQNVQVKYVFPATASDSVKFINDGLYDSQTNTLWLRGDNVDDKSTLAHELQHAIQMGSDGADRDTKLSELYPYDINPMEQEARYAELTFQEENLADGLQRPRHTYETFFEESKRLVRDMYGNKIFRETQNAISEVAESLQSMVDSYKDDNPYPVKDVAALEYQLLSVYNDAAESKDISESDLGGFASIYNRLRALSEDFRIRQANILKKTGRLSLPNRNMIGEDTLNASSTPGYQATIVVRDANGVAISIKSDDVPTLDGKPTTDEIGGAIVNADNKVLRKLRKGDTTIKDDAKPKDPIVYDPNATGDENNKFSLLDWLRSPSRLAKKFRKVFEFFAKTFDTAYRVQNQLRYEWHNMLKETTEFLPNVEDFNLFNDLMLYGDTYGRYNDKGEYENTGIDFDANQLNGMIYYTDADGKKVFVPSDQQFIPEGVETHQLPENVAKAYLKVRELTETIYAAVDRARRSGLIKTEKANLQRILQINDPKNRAEGYVEIKGSDGQYHSLDEFRQYLNGKDTYDIRYAKIRVIDQKAAEVNITEDRLKEIENDDTLELHTQTHTPKANGLYDVVYTKYMPHMGHRRGHVPHIFERWMVAYVNDDGSYTIQDSQKTVNAARESITKFQEQDADNNIQRQYVIFPKAFDFGSFNGADEITGGGALATQKQKQEMYVNLIKNYMMTPEEANRAVNAAMRTSVKNRIYGQAVKRKGVAGYSKDVMDALIREVTAASRYCALQPAKHTAIDRYEHLFNMNYNADVKIGDNPLQAMVKSYIDDCNGKPSKAEQLLNRTLNNWNWYRNNVSATYGDRAILKATSTANQIVSMAKLGFWNISSAVVNLFQNMNTIALCGFGHFGEGVKAFRDLKFKDKDKLTDKELADYLLNEQIIEQTGVKYDIGTDSATGYSMRLERLKNNTDVGTPKGLLQVIYDNYVQIGDKGLALFSTAESANRQICVLTAYRDGIAKGMTHDEAIEYAREVNKKANFDYGVADAPAFMRAMSGTGVGEMMMLFQKYPVKELELMCEMCKKAMSNTEGDKAQAARFWGMYFLMSGIGGIPFLDGFDEWLEHLFGYKPSKRAKLELIDTFGDNAFTRSVCYGVGAAAGIDISQRVGMGDLKFGNSQMMFPFNFGGAAGSTLKQMIEAAMEGDPVHIAKAFSPSIGAVLEAGQGYSTDKKGRLRTLYSVPQMLVRSTGFRPIEDSVNADLNTALTEQRSDDRNEKSKFKYQIALKQTQGQPLTADDQRKLRTMNISGKQLADARKQIKQSFAKRAKELMSKEQRQRYGSVYEDFEREEDDI